MHINIYNNSCKRCRKQETNSSRVDILRNKQIRAHSELSLDSTAALWGALPNLIATLTLQLGHRGTNGCTQRVYNLWIKVFCTQPKSPLLSVNISWVSCQALHTQFHLASISEVAVFNNIHHFVSPFGQFSFPIAQIWVASTENSILCHVYSCPLASCAFEAFLTLWCSSSRGLWNTLVINAPLPRTAWPVILLKLSVHNTFYFSALLYSFLWILVPAQTISIWPLLSDFAMFITEHWSADRGGVSWSNSPCIP